MVYHTEATECRANQQLGYGGPLPRGDMTDGASERQTLSSRSEEDADLGLLSLEVVAISRHNHGESPDAEVDDSGSYLVTHATRLA